VDVPRPDRRARRPRRPVGSGSCSRVTSRAPPSRHRGATSTRAARSPSGVAWSSPSCARSDLGVTRAVTSRWHRGRRCSSEFAHLPDPFSRTGMPLRPYGDAVARWARS
jgi:hypothetical protein